MNGDCMPSRWMRWRTNNRYVERYDVDEEILNYGIAELTAKLLKYFPRGWLDSAARKGRSAKSAAKCQWLAFEGRRVRLQAILRGSYETSWLRSFAF